MEPWTRRSGGVGGLGLLVGVALFAAGTVEPVRGQGGGSGEGLHVVPGIAVGYFSTYVTEDSRTQHVGIDLSARIGTTTGGALELGYTYVPQGTTSSSAAPRLHAFRAMLVGSVPAQGGPSPSVRLTGGLGAAALVVRAQRIDCGDFPLCAEWAPGSGTRKAVAAGFGVVVDVTRHLGGLAEIHLYRPLGGEWSAAGDPTTLIELGAGVRFVLGR